MKILKGNSVLKGKVKLIEVLMGGKVFLILNLCCKFDPQVEEAASAGLRSLLVTFHPGVSLLLEMPRHLL